ncbi:T9SS type A sorting domain-containing protein, partial [Saprospiraceae bacterium]|nr:T9SS type A sorting domain-containing protein [Saprospiraceae bacterium]
ADKLKVGYGGFEGQIGPELGFGHLLGEHFQDQVLIIKTCWGGKGLAVDFRPPSSGGIVGPYYNQMISDITETINNINIEFPQYNGGQIDIAGFCWFQGWNDGEQNSYLNEYEENLKNLISDVRADLNVPDLPFVVGLTGNGGYDLLQGDLWIQGLQTILVPAQVNAVEYTGHYNVRYAETRDYWIPADSSPADAGHHWHNNAESYLRIGNVLGLKMIELLGVINSKKNLISAPQNIKVFPSPANNYFQTECEQNNFHLNILDINGRIVESLKDISSSTKVNIEKLKEGIYFIDILNLDGSSIGIKQLVKN